MRRLSFLLAIAGLALAATPAEAYDPQHTHRWITRQAIAKLVAEYPGQYDELLEYADEVAGGVEDEDDSLLDGDSDPTTLRVMRHFFRPTDGQGLFMVGQQFPSSYVWGAEPNDINQWDWSDGMAAWRAGDKARAYRTLGHMVHLIEDATVPAHTHLDIHGPPAGDDYEGYCSSKTSSEWDSDLPTPAPGAAIPLFHDSYEAWVATATASWNRNLYPGDLSNPDAGAAGRLHEMFPDLGWDWFWKDWRGSLGVLDKDFFLAADGLYYVKNAEAVGAVDKLVFDPAGSGGDVYGPNTTGAPMVELFARDLIPIAILHSAGVMKLYLDEAYATPVDPTGDDAGPATGEDELSAGGCRIATRDSGAPVSLLCAALVAAFLLVAGRFRR